MSAVVYLFNKGPGTITLLGVPLLLGNEGVVLRPEVVATVKPGDGFEYEVANRHQALFVEERLPPN